MIKGYLILICFSLIYIKGFSATLNATSAKVGYVTNSTYRSVDEWLSFEGVSEGQTISTNALTNSVTFLTDWVGGTWAGFSSLCPTATNIDTMVRFKFTTRASQRLNHFYFTN